MNININDYLKYNSNSDDISKYFTTYLSNNSKNIFDEDINEIENISENISTPILNSVNNPIINKKTVNVNYKTPVKEKENTTSSISTNVNNFKSDKDFIKQILPIANKIAKEKGIDPNIILSQAALESNYGKNTLTKKANNIFSIQVPKNKQGKGKGFIHTDSDVLNNKYNTEFEKDNNIEDNIRRWANMIFNPSSKNYKASAKAALINADEFNKVHAASPYAEGIGKTSEERYNFKYNSYKNAYNKILKLRKELNI